MRTATITRTTKETAITISLNLDQQSGIDIDTGIGFFDHMLDAFAKHGRLGLIVKAQGDLDVDRIIRLKIQASSWEVALNKRWVTKLASNALATHLCRMDESLARVVVDLSGRAYLVFDAELTNQRLGGFDTEVTEDFFQAMAFAGEFNLHAAVLYGRNTHHKIEALFKALGRSMQAAVALNPAVKGIPQPKE